jgi:ankyrin repeat protein
MANLGMANKVDQRVVKDSNGKNLLHFAAAKGHLEICKFLVGECGLDVNSLSTEGLNHAHSGLLLCFCFSFFSGTEVVYE